MGEKGLLVRTRVTDAFAVGQPKELDRSFS